jgi:glycerophosphoryl diester phosphodiesterase
MHAVTLVGGGALRLIAHRGGRGFGTDNTLEAMENAARSGVRCIETDVRETLDGRLVICHDAIIRGHAVSRMTYAELKGREPERPLLLEILEKLAGWVSFDIEVKDAPELALGEALEAYGIEADGLVTSFNRDFLERFKGRFPGVKTGLLFRMSYGQERKLHNGAAAGADVVLPHHGSIDREMLLSAHGRGLEVYAWTVNAVDDLKRLVDFGVDGIVTDDYLRFESFLEGENIEVE